MRQSEFKNKYDPDTGKYTRQHIYGEGISDKVRSFGTNLFKKTAKKPPPKKPDISKKAGDKIVKMLNNAKIPSKKKVTLPSHCHQLQRKKCHQLQKKMTQHEINNRVLQIMSGGKII